MMKDRSMKERVRLCGALALFIMFTVFFYGPLSLYLPNAEELWFQPGIVLRIILPVSLLAFGIALGIGLLLPKKAYLIYTRLLMGISLGLYIQGNYINVSYGSGVMDGTEIVWKNYTGIGAANTIFWIVVLLLPWGITLAFQKIKALRSQKEISADQVLMYLALFCFVIQIPALISQVITYKPYASGNLVVTDEGIYELAPEGNTILILVDTLDERFMQTYLEEYPQAREAFGGFVHYTNVVAAGGRTILAMPALFTGQPFTRQSLYSEYKKEVWSEKNVLSAMSDAGMDVRVFSEEIYFDSVAADYVENMYSDVSSVPSSYPLLAQKLYKMTMFKFAPHFAKRFFVTSTMEFDEAKTAENLEGKSLYTVNDPQFFAKYKEQGFSVSSAYSSAFRLYHLHGAHSPYTMAADGTAVEKSNRSDQVAGVFTNISVMLGELKEMGLFDSSNIIIMADHGDRSLAEWSTVLIKEAGRGDDLAMEDSAVPLSGFDITIWLAELAGTKLENQEYGMRIDDLTEGMQRERHYFYNTTNSVKVTVKEYVQNSDASDKDALTFVASYEDVQTADTKYKLGEVLEFGGDATANRYVVDGFGNSTGFTTHVRGPHAEMVIPFEEVPDQEMIKVKLTQDNYGLGKEIQITANGVLVHSQIIDENAVENGMEFQIATAVFEGDNILTLEFDFPDVDPDQMEESVKKRERVASFITIAFS